MLIVTYVWILTSNRSTVAYRSGFAAVGTLSYRCIAAAHNFGASLSPDHLRRELTR